MKLAAFIGLVLALLIFVSFVLNRAPDKPAPPLSDEERTKYDAIVLQVLEKNPALKADDVSLKSRADLTRQQKRIADDAYGEAHRALDDHNRKVMEAGSKIDPSIEGIYFRLQGIRPDGARELITYDSQSPLFRFNWRFLSAATGLLAMVVGLFLIFRPPSYAEANLYLALAILPALVAGPMSLTQGDMAYIWHLSGIYEGPSIPRMLLIFHRDFMWAYLSSVPCLLLYVGILLRIYRRSILT